MNNISEAIIQLLKAKLPESKLEMETDGAHYVLHIQAKEFQGKTKIEQHKMIYCELKPLLASGDLHAVELFTSPL